MMADKLSKMAVVVQGETQLSVKESQKFARLKKVVKGGMKTVWEVAEALETIRNERLYRAHYPTFEAFCAAELSMSGRRARQLSDASGVVRNLLGEGSGESGTIVPKWPEGGTKPSTHNMVHFC
jgi:hypothetical protein